LFVNLKKCAFLSPSVHFLVFIVYRDGVADDLDKVNVIREWPTSSTIHDAMSFYSLATFCKRFARGFSTIMVPITECLKKLEFKWTKSATKAFEEIKEKLIAALVLRFPNFMKVFEVASNAFGVGISRVLSQESHHVAFFSEKLNAAKQL